ncbi:MAG: cytochrome-c peroxidase [Bacteroidetes bacterium]|nr:MAG: cytochrome-c peroxidase [Bacteroidota bacterium]
MKFKITIFLILSTLVLIVSCKDDEKEPQGIVHDTTPYTLTYGNFPTPDIADDNELTIQGVQLGRMLFYETMLSGDGEMACASCHLQEFAFTDTARFSTGIRGNKGGRQAMTIFNMAWHENEFFWDGRAHLLRDQSLLPIQDELEMDETLENVVAKLSESQLYKDQFIRVFGTDKVTSEKISLALEQFMNSITSTNSKYDEFLEDSTVFTESEKRGFELFTTDYNPFFPDESGADCQHCHSSLNFENDKYMNNGLDATFADEGREKATENAQDKGKFKVTSLRNIALTAPYMHDGRFTSLEEVVEHYNSQIKASLTLDPALEQTREKGLFLTEQDKSDLVAFLRTLTDKNLMNNNNYSNPF